MPTIVFVCTANRYRSPLAAACFRKELQERKMKGDWQVLSAGTWGTGRLPAASEALRDADRMGLDISGHASHGVHAELMRAADLVIVMEQEQKEELQTEFPPYADKVYLLSEVTTGKAYDIPDPVTPMLADNGVVTQEISELIHRGFERICAIALADPKA